MLRVLYFVSRQIQYFLPDTRMEGATLLSFAGCVSGHPSICGLLCTNGRQNTCGKVHKYQYRAVRQ